jgi:deazaflavin-dependent oxidoreductase (nitroreductase family)|tara:strand:- start:6386 stop:6829 length:444 start_codon:yes stop_codon:yes gene_type:complete
MVMTDPKLPNWIADHVQLYLEDPEKAHQWDSSMAGGSGVLPTLLLETVGRKTGIKRMLPLIYKKVGDDYVIIASKGGFAKHPVWYLNLIHDPQCDIRVGKDIFSARARVAEGQERNRLWEELVEIYPPYTAYQEATDRVIPVVVLEV